MSLGHRGHGGHGRQIVFLVLWCRAIVEPSRCLCRMWGYLILKEKGRKKKITEYLFLHTYSTELIPTCMYMELSEPFVGVGRVITIPL